MAKYLPAGEATDYQYRISLEGTGYDIRTRWNPRSEYWSVSIGPTGEPPAITTKALVGRDLLGNYAVSGLPPGKLYVVDIEKGFGRPSVDDFGLGRRFRLLYVTQSDPDPVDFYEG